MPLANIKHVITENTKNKLEVSELGLKNNNLNYMHSICLIQQHVPYIKNRKSPCTGLLTFKIH